MYRIGNAAIRPYPFPHIFVEEVFPSDFYAMVRRHMPLDEAYRTLVDTGRVGKGYSPSRLCLFPEDLATAPLKNEDREFWRELFAAFTHREFTEIWLRLFGPIIQQRLAEENERSKQRLIYSEIMLMRDRNAYSLGPHTDSRQKAVSVLFYLPEDDTAPGMGTSFYLPKDRAFTCAGGPNHLFDRFDRIATASYRPNTLVAFPKTSRSFHGVEPVNGIDIRRDLIIYDLKLRDE